MESGEDAELCAYQDNHSGRTRISIHDGPLSKSTCKLLNRVVPNGTLRGVEGESQISPIRFWKILLKSLAGIRGMEDCDTIRGARRVGEG